MAARNGEGNIAVLIDGDNVSSKIVDGLMTEVVKYGSASVRRIYGDWTSPQMKSWRECLLQHSIVPIQQFAYTTGKNATDGAMIIDAMDLMYTGRFSGFCLVSSDSDFTRLAARIREQGIPVYGFGNRRTHKAFVAACNEFTYFDAWIASAAAPNGDSASPASASGASTQLPTRTASEASPMRASRRPPLASGSPQDFSEFARRAIIYAINSVGSPDEDEWANLAEIGQVMLKISPDLSPRNFGFERLKDFVAASGVTELKMKSRDRGPPIAYVRLNERGERRLEEMRNNSSAM